MSPEDMTPGRIYRWRYKSADGPMDCGIGRFVRIGEVEYGTLWFWFTLNYETPELAYDSPWDYAALNDLLLVEEEAACPPPLG